MHNALAAKQVSRWRADHVGAIALASANIIPRISQPRPVIEGVDVWDSWPVQHVDGRTVDFDGWSAWMVLAAPALADPDMRHDVARIRLMTERDGGWLDCGVVLPDGINPGSREWSGSCVYDPGTGRFDLFYTVAGYEGEPAPSFAQRIFQTHGRLDVSEGRARIADVRPPVECFESDGEDYVLVDQAEGRPGCIKGFRDPGFFRDPATGLDYLLFTGSLKQSRSEWNGCVGIARADDGDWSSWSLLPPLLTADGLNNEQERPHVVVHDGLYYLFWSTQRRVFAPDGPSGPTGLYGMVAPSLFGPYEPLNGTGLVAANPPERPFQGYSWWVEKCLRVASFVDLAGVSEIPEDADAAFRRAHFGGTPAPFFRIALDRDRAWVSPTS